MSEPDSIRLRHMLDAATEALTFVRGRAKADLAADQRLTLALIREMEIVGVAANKISDGTRQQYPDVPWSAIIGMGDRLSHAYVGFDPEVVWSTVTVDLPDIVGMVKGMLR